MKQYPLYEYEDICGRSIRFAYIFTEDEMCKYNKNMYTNGLYHYNYFEDKCKAFIRKKYGILNTFGRARNNALYISTFELFINNVLGLVSKNRSINIIKPLKGYYNTSELICLKNLCSDRYKTIITGKDYNYIDMVSLHCTGTRAYTDLISVANCVSLSLPIAAGRILFIHNDIPVVEDSSDIYEININKTTILRFKNLEEFYKTKNSESFVPVNGEIFLIKDIYESSSYQTIVFTNPEDYILYFSLPDGRKSFFYQ